MLMFRFIEIRVMLYYHSNQNAIEMGLKMIMEWISLW